jgi:hypothetical protein
MTVTVKAIDAAVPSVTVATDEGRVVTRKIENKKNLENLQAGRQESTSPSRGRWSRRTPQVTADRCAVGVALA